MGICNSILINLKNSKASLIDSVCCSEILNYVNRLNYVLIISSHTLHNRNNVVLIATVVGILRLECIILQIWISSLICVIMGANIKSYTSVKHGVPVSFETYSVTFTVLRSATACQRIMRSRQNKFFSFFGLFYLG